MGWISHDGIVPLSLERDIGGPMARTVQDTALLFSVMAGSDDHDPVTLEAPAIPKTIALNPEGLEGARDQPHIRIGRDISQRGYRRSKSPDFVPAGHLGYAKRRRKDGPCG